MNTLTVEEFKNCLPVNLKKSLNKDLVDQIMTTLQDPDIHEAFRENLLSYTSVMKEGKFKTESYVNAVKYVSYKLMGKTNIDAYSLTFPERIQDYASRGLIGDAISSYVFSYNASKLVNLIYEQTMIPIHVVNRAVFQQAINTQADLMLNARSEKVRSDAANSIMSHLKPPEKSRIELDVNVKQDSTIEILRQGSQELIAQQKLAIQAGLQNAQTIAHTPIVLEHEDEAANG